MHREPVDSEMIVSIGYSSETATLEIEFRRGTLYRYFAVPAGVHADLMKAPSKGAYFTQFIRDKYPHDQQQLA